MLDQGRALVATGLATAGYRTVVVDDCWMARGQDGRLQGVDRWGSYKHPSRQPGFDRDLTRYMAALHGMGLKGGLYNTAGTTTCQRVAAGEAGHQDQDAATFAAWGVDFLKLDNCGADDPQLPPLFRRMSEALGRATAHSGRPILFDESLPAQYDPTDPAKYRAMAEVRPLGQMWRVAPDIRITHLGPDGRPLYDPWSFNDIAQGYEEGVYQAYTDAVALSRYVSPGNWNDADQLLIGDDGLTPAEARGQMGLWSVLGAPLILSADVRELARDRGDPGVAAALSILTNPRAVAIDQDALGAGGYRVLRERSADDMGVDISLKPLSDGGAAFLILNKGPIPIDYALPLARLGVMARPCALTLTDVWRGATRVVDAGAAFTARIGPHDNAMLRIAPAACLSLIPTGEITVAQASFGVSGLCLESGGDGDVTIETCSGSASQAWRMERDGHVRQAAAAMCLQTQDGGSARVAPCAAVDAQRFAYHRSGALVSPDGRCLTVRADKVGHGGLLGQDGAELALQQCADDNPGQAFSAPALGSAAGLRSTRLRARR